MDSYVEIHIRGEHIYSHAFNTSSIYKPFQHYCSHSIYLPTTNSCILYFSCYRTPSYSFLFFSSSTSSASSSSSSPHLGIPNPHQYILPLPPTHITITITIYLQDQRHKRDTIKFHLSFSLALLPSLLFPYTLAHKIFNILPISFFLLRRTKPSYPSLAFLPYLMGQL